MARRDLLALLLLFFHPRQINGFPTGAGACPGGMAAATGHPAPDSTGELSNFGLQVTLDGSPLSTSGATDFSAGSDHTLELSGGSFKGFLLRLDGGSNSVDTTSALAGNSGLAQVAQFVCIPLGVGGVTHTSSSTKSSVQATLRVDEADTNLPLDVTVVVSNNLDDGSEYYYSRFLLNSVLVLATPEPTPVPTPAPTPESTPAPTPEPTPTPTSEPTQTPTLNPTSVPTISIFPTSTAEPSTFPTTEPSTSPPTTMAPVAPTPAPAPREVSIRNPNFERDNNAWKVTEGTAMRECGAGNEKNGDCNIAFTGSVERQRIKQRLRDIEGASEGTVFKLKFWVMAEDLMTKGDFKVYLKLKGLDGSTSTSTCKSSEKGTFEYTKMKCKFTADKFVEKATLIFQYSSTEGALYLDKISMTEG